MTAIKSNFLIYGAGGYTGSLIARMAVEQGLKPLLAGRDGGRMSAQAAELGLAYRSFALEDAPRMDAALAEVAAVLHCAGPFSGTAEPMMAGCLRNGTHYLDITGEVSVFERAARLDGEAKAAGIMLLPGVGFDVVPSDCLAAHLKQKLPTATRLSLAFQALSTVSRGTAATMAENPYGGGLVRREGILTPVEAAWKTRSIDFGAGPAEATTIPWGDVSTAYYSTGIPNIEVYAAFPAPLRWAMVAGRYLGGLFDLPPVKSIQQQLLKSRPPGPDDQARAQGLSRFWGEVEDPAGKRFVSRLRTVEGYTLTALTALAAARKVLFGNFKPGFQTPSLAYGPDFILEIPGVERSDDAPHAQAR